MNDWLDAADRLAERIVGGEVVFFIGAGYSLQSEGNSAKVLIARLLARFDAICEYLERGDLPIRHQIPQQQWESLEGKFNETVEDLRAGLWSTFRLGDHGVIKDGPFFVPVVARKLTERYYELNDWMCNAYSILLTMVECLGDTDLLVEGVNQTESDRFAKFETEKDDGFKVLPSVLKELRNIVKLRDHHCMGKALFLATMGFEDPMVMGGNPERPIADMNYKPLEKLIGPRHMVLAWMAREGLCPTLLTTNYDLLLEGAFRLAGFRLNVPSEVDTARNVDARHRDTHIEALPVARYEQCTRVARDVQYFNAGGAHQTALIYKIHGCVQTYRKATHDIDDWKRYLNAMVFTFREIQTWRDDSWSRDLLYTLLRTRTVAFSGYSAADPVIHDTFRSVYEDMAERRGVTPDAPQNRFRSSADNADPKQAPAFFMDIQDKNDFHGLEILRSASRSVGESLPPLSTHPNRLEFFVPSNESDEKPGHRLTLDDMQLWVFRCAIRRQQQKLLRMHLWSATQAVWQRPQEPEEMAQVQAVFNHLISAENTSVRDATERRRPGKRGIVDTVCRGLIPWVTTFHPMLMREFAIAEATHNPSSETEKKLQHRLKIEKCLRESPWYFPLADRPAWAAWAIVVEIAVRRMVAMLHRYLAPEPKKPSCSRWASDAWLVKPIEADNPADSSPAMEFPAMGGLKTPTQIRIKVEVVDVGFPPSDEPRATPENHRKVLRWLLSPTSIPWSTAGERKASSRSNQPPDADLLWRIASIPEGGLEAVVDENPDGVMDIIRQLLLPGKEDSPGAES